MKYTNIYHGKFISRPNRFIAYIEISGKTEVCHVKNTGRCKELLIEGADVFVQKSANPLRKTAYDLISVYKNGMLINMDSQAPNKVFHEWAKDSGFFGEISTIKPEYKYKNSRFDFYIESGERKILVEVKGVTLENEGVVSFPDAPTERGVKHLNELIDAKKNGFETYVFFIIQMERCKYFAPNRKNHPEFADILLKAKKEGVGIRALKCKVSKTEITAYDFVKTEIK